MPPEVPGPRLTPAQALLLAKTVSDVYAEATARLLALIANRLARGIDTPTWATQRLGEVLALRQAAQRIVTGLQSASSNRVLRVLETAYDGGNLTQGPGGGGLVRGNQRAVLAFAADLNRLLESTHTRILRSTEDIYRQVIAETAGPLVTGVVDRRATASAALDRLAAAGIRGFTDSSGRHWNLDSYVEMATRSTVGHTYLQGTLDRFTASGRDLVVVSDSPEECPLCRPFEQKVLSIAGVRRPDDVPEHKWAGSLTAAISRGLFHPNCTHSLGAWVPGLVRLKDDTENPLGYDERQRQRELERRVRESKRRVAALQPLGDTPRLRQQKALLASRRAALKQFVDDHGRKAWVSQKRTQVRPPGDAGSHDLPPSRPPAATPPASEDEKDAIGWYTDAGYVSINHGLRTGILSDSDRQSIATIDAFLDRNRVDRDAGVLRITTAHELGLGHAADVGDALGQIVEVPAYLSCTLDEAPQGGKLGASKDAGEAILLDVVVLRNTPAAYVGGLSEYPLEREYLVAHGRRLLIGPARYDEDHQVWRVLCWVLPPERTR